MLLRHQTNDSKETDEKSCTNDKNNSLDDNGSALNFNQKNTTPGNDSKISRISSKDDKLNLSNPFSISKKSLNRSVIII